MGLNSPVNDTLFLPIAWEGRFGEANIRIANRPSPDNPATSYLAALSVMALLRREDEVFVVGN